MKNVNLYFKTRFIYLIFLLYFMFMKNIIIGPAFASDSRVISAEETNKIENRTGMMVDGISPYVDVDFLSNVPNYTMGNGSTKGFFLAPWYGYEIHQSLIFKEVFLTKNYFL